MKKYPKNNDIFQMIYNIFCREKKIMDNIDCIKCLQNNFKYF
jgi:hypothetical protein